MSPFLRIIPRCHIQLGIILKYGDNLHIRGQSLFSETINVKNDTGYSHDGRADNTAYRHDRRADKRRYPHDREINIQMLKMSRN